MHSAQDLLSPPQGVRTTPTSHQPDPARATIQQSACPVCAARPRKSLPLRSGVTSLEHWLDLNA